MQNKKALSLLLTANAVSGFAQGISMLAIPWYFVNILQKAPLFGYLYALATTSTIFVGLYGGTLIDKYPRKNIFLGLNMFGFMVLSAASISGYILGETPVVLTALVFCLTMFNYNIHYPTLYAFAQEITVKEKYGKINSLIEIQGQATSIFSGALAALLFTGINHEMLEAIGLENYSLQIKPWKLHEIFLLDASTYVIAMTLIVMIKYEPVENLKRSSGNIIKRLKEGIQFLKINPLLFYFGTASFAIFVTLLVHVHYLMPIYVTNHLQAPSYVYAIAEMTYAIGALLAGIGIRWVFRKKNPVFSIIVLMFLSVAVYLLCFFTKSAFILSAVCFTLGITNAGTRILRITYLFEHTPNNIIGRSGSVFQTLNILSRSFLIMLFSIGFFSQSSNIIWAYAINALFVLLSIIPLVFFYQKLITFKVNKLEP